MSRLLADAQGYAVCAADGRSLGRLIWLLYDLDHLWPAGFRVQPRGEGETTYSGSWEISAAQVVAVHPITREVTVVIEPAAPAGRGRERRSRPAVRGGGHRDPPSATVNDAPVSNVR